MANYIEYNDKIAFHPGYYIKEIVEESGLTQEDFAKRLDTTPKNLSILIRGEQRLSIEIAMKLSRMLGTSVSYWLNLQNNYDSLIAEFQSEKELVQEREVFHLLDYTYFKSNFHLPDATGDIDEQIRIVREFLKVSTLSVFTKRDMAVSFRNTKEELDPLDIVKANIMVQIAVNQALDKEVPRFNKGRFDDGIEEIVDLVKSRDSDYTQLDNVLQQLGVIMIVLPDFPGTTITGATKKLGKNVVLMINDRCFSVDTFLFTLFHEIGHILNGDYGVSFKEGSGEKEDIANQFANAMISLIMSSK